MYFFSAYRYQNPCKHRQLYGIFKLNISVILLNLCQMLRCRSEVKLALLPQIEKKHALISLFSQALRSRRNSVPR